MKQRTDRLSTQNDYNRWSTFKKAGYEYWILSHLGRKAFFFLIVLSYNSSWLQFLLHAPSPSVLLPVSLLSQISSFSVSLQKKASLQNSFWDRRCGLCIKSAYTYLCVVILFQKCKNITGKKSNWRTLTTTYFQGDLS